MVTVDVLWICKIKKRWEPDETRPRFGSEIREGSSYLIPPEMIKKSFIKCGISSAMDGTEDDAIYEDDSTSDDIDNKNNIYADDVTDEQFNQLFGHSDDENSNFENFECETWA